MGILSAVRTGTVLLVLLMSMAMVMLILIVLLKWLAHVHLHIAPMRACAVQHDIVSLVAVALVVHSELVGRL
jgi:hypothetical protein